MNIEQGDLPPFSGGCNPLFRNSSQNTMDELTPEAPRRFAPGTIPNPDMPGLSPVKSDKRS